MSDWIRVKDANTNGFMNSKKKLQIIFCETVAPSTGGHGEAWQAIIACYDELSTMVPWTVALKETEEELVQSVEDFVDAADKAQDDFLKAVRELSNCGLVIKGVENANAFHDRDLRPAPEQISTLLIGGRYYGAACYIDEARFSEEKFLDVLVGAGLSAHQAESLLCNLRKYTIGAGEAVAEAG